MISNLKNTVVVALSEDHVSTITGLSKGQLRAWDKRGFFVPRFAYDDRKSSYSRIYSFKDVVGLKTLAQLRQDHKITISKLEVVAQRMETKGFAHWADTRLYVINRQVHFRDPTSGKIEGIEDGQLAMLEVIEVINDVTQQVEKLKKRNINKVGKVERHRYVARNSWVVAGTRIPTATIRRYAEAGFTKDQILAEYPTLKLKDVDAALKHEKRLAKSA